MGKKASLASRIRAKIWKSSVVDDAAVARQQSEKLPKIEGDYAAVKKNPGQLTGWDFERAFGFLEKYPDSEQAEILKNQMYATRGQALKGLSYASAVKILEQMPDHPGTEAIIRGMRLLEEDYIPELKSDIIAYIIEKMPDHPLARALVKALVSRNMTTGYNFVIKNPDNIHTMEIIREMFTQDANVSLLLLQEKMDHPRVASIFEGIYNISKESDIKRLTPNAIIFIFEIAPDHPHVELMVEVLVENNYVKAYDFWTRYPDHMLAGMLKEKILAHKPELSRLFA